MAEPNQKSAKKLNRHVQIALNHMNQRLAALREKREQLTKEIEELETAIQALG